MKRRNPSSGKSRRTESSTGHRQARNNPRKDIALSGEVRLNRYIARSGICSRREADNLIESGVVQINGEVVTTLGTKIMTTDEVIVNGKHIAPVGLDYLLVNKPSNTITTVSDERGRRTVMDLISGPDFKDAGLFPVGRLDRDTTGLLLITNDGTLAHRLTHPSFEIEKIYRVRTRNPISDEQIKELKAGIELEDGLAAVDRVERVSGGENNEVGLSIHEGRNRQIRRMFEKLGHEVLQLERVRYAGLTTRGVRNGKWRRLKPEEVTQLYRLVKL